jgi:hypothetical protein
MPAAKKTQSKSPANKTQPNRRSVQAFLRTVAGDTRRADCEKILTLMQDLSGEPPTMWNTSIVGFGEYHYQYASGREGDYFALAFHLANRTLLCMSCRGSAISTTFWKHWANIAPGNPASTLNAWTTFTYRHSRK